ncbi:MAG: hypothetical protein N3A65_09055 [candidate division WOR-3 bacterium]|nr:hypothetical protein [candidate division WOR-3 bacterium]
MKKVLVLSSFLIFFACESGVEINLECWVKHTCEVVNVETSILGEKTRVFINLTWGWTLQRPQIDAVIVERSSDSTTFIALDTIPVDTVMSFNDSDTMLIPSTKVYYRLKSLYGKDTDHIIDIAVNIPSPQNFYRPDSEYISIPNDTLCICFARIPGFDTTDVAIYKGAPSSIDSLLHNLTNPLFDTTVADTIIYITNVDSLIPVDTIPYTIRISSSKISALDYITDTSIGFRAFIRE